MDKFCHNPDCPFHFEVPEGTRSQVIIVNGQSMESMRFGIVGTDLKLCRSCVNIYAVLSNKERRFENPVSNG